MKIAVVYTATTPELVAGVEEELKKHIAGDIAVASYQDAFILQEAQKRGLTPECARRLVKLYEQGVNEGADLILNVCSSVGEVAKLAKPLYERCGVGFVRIDEAMAMEAARTAARIGVVATLPTTLNPTKALIQECADALGKEVLLVDALAEGAFGLNQEEFKQKLVDTGAKVKDKVDLLLFAQGSMAYAEQDVSKALGIPVFSSIRFGVKAVADRVREMTAK